MSSWVRKKLGHLDDVATTAPDDGDVPIYDGGTGLWTPGPQSGGGASAVADLTDVDLDGLDDGDGLVYDSTLEMWVPVALAGGAVPAGGTAGQVLTKQSATDFDTGWETPSGGGGGGGVDLIDEVVLTSAGTIDFTGIPDSYTDLRIVARLRATHTVADGFAVRMGDGTLDTGTNYRFHQNLQGSTTTNVASDSASSARIGTAPPASSRFCALTVDLLAYTRLEERFMVGESGYILSGSVFIRSNATGVWTNTSDVPDAIQLRTLTPSGGEFTSGSWARLYGIG